MIVFVFVCVTQSQHLDIMECVCFHRDDMVGWGEFHITINWRVQLVRLLFRL